MEREESDGAAAGGGAAEERALADVGADAPEAVDCSVGEGNTLVMRLRFFLDEDYCPAVTLHLQPKAVDATERLAARLRDAEEEIVRVRAAFAQAAARFCIPALSLRTTHQVNANTLLQWNTAVPGVTCPDVFALDQGDATVVRVRVHGVYQLHVSIAQMNSANAQYLCVLVNGQERCRSYESNANGFHQQATVFDILELNANDAITVRPHANSNTYHDVLANRLNLTLLQRL
jgi:hypothetical protein